MQHGLRQWIFAHVIATIKSHDVAKTERGQRNTTLQCGTECSKRLVLTPYVNTEKNPTPRREKGPLGPWVLKEADADLV